MTRLAPTIRSVLTFGAVCLLLGGLLAIVIGAVSLVSGRGEPQLRVSQGGEVAIPEAGLFGGSVMAYTGSPAGAGPRQLGCEVITEDGALASSLRMGAFDHALRDPITVDGTTWYPLTEVDLTSSPATLRCPGDVLSPAGVAEPSTFGGLTNLVSWTAFSFGLISISMGAIALVALRLTRR